MGMAALIGTSFVACNKQSQAPATTTSDSSAAASLKESIVFVNSDTLLEKYEYFKEIRTTLEDKAKKAQADLQARSTAFQREVADYQQKAPTMSGSDRESTEERLARKQDELARHQQNASNALAQEEMDLNEKLYGKITEYLKQHAKENGYKYVLTYSTASPSVLFADESLDITPQVLKALNDAYLKDKK